MPCNSNPEKYMEFFNIINSEIVPILQPMDRLILMGDFNMPNVEWEFVDDFLTPINLNAEMHCFISDVFSLGLKQCVQLKNNFENILDLVFLPLDQEVCVSACEDLTGSSSIFHTPINISLHFDFCEPVNDNVKSLSYNLKKGDYGLLNTLS